MIIFAAFCFLPLWLYARYKQSQKLKNDTEENKFKAIKKNWFLTPVGLSVSIICLGAINVTWALAIIIAKHSGYSTPAMSRGAFILPNIVPLFMWLLPVIEFLEHKKNYLYFYQDRIAYRFGRKKREIMIDQIQEIKKTKSQFLFGLKTGERIAFKMNVLDNFVGSKQLSEKLNTINASK
jgi:hypothetical protein